MRISIYDEHLCLITCSSTWDRHGIHFLDLVELKIVDLINMLTTYQKKKKIGSTDLSAVNEEVSSEHEMDQGVKSGLIQIWTVNTAGTYYIETSSMTRSKCFKHFWRYKKKIKWIFYSVIFHCHLNLPWNVQFTNLIAMNTHLKWYVLELFCVQIRNLRPQFEYSIIYLRGR